MKAAMNTYEGAWKNCFPSFSEEVIDCMLAHRNIVVIDQGPIIEMPEI